MTSWNNSSGMPTFLRYKKPTSIKAWRRFLRNSGFVAGSLAAARSRMGIDVNDMTIRREAKVRKELIQDGRKRVFSTCENWFKLIWYLSPLRWCMVPLANNITPQLRNSTLRPSDLLAVLRSGPGHMFPESPPQRPEDQQLCCISCSWWPQKQTVTLYRQNLLVS